MLVALLIAPPARAQVVGCDTSEADPWVVETRAWLLATDDPSPLAVNRFVAGVVQALGEPSGCVGGVTSVFDGRSFGELTLTFEGGVDLVFETMAPDFTVVSLETRSGFPDPVWARGVMTTLSRDWGLDIDWTAAERSTDGDLTREAYWDPDAGINGQFRLSYRNDTLVAMTISRS